MLDEAAGPAMLYSTFGSNQETISNASKITTFFGGPLVEGSKIGGPWQDYFPK